MIHEFKIILGLPDKPLSPNSRTHWGARSKATKEHRTAAAHLAEIEIRQMRKALGENDFKLTHKWERVFISPVFYFKDKRRRDRDNCSASLKAARDGICDAMKRYGMVDDDDQFVPMPPKILKDKHLPRVEVTISRELD